MSKERNINLPQHHFDQGHYGELPLSSLPSGTLSGTTFLWDGTSWVIGTVSGSGSGSGGGSGGEIVFGDNQNFDSSLGDWAAPAGGLLLRDESFGIFKEGSTHFGGALFFNSNTLEYSQLVIDHEFKAGRRYWAGAQIQAPSGTTFDVAFHLGTPSDAGVTTTKMVAIGTNRDVDWMLVETQWVPDADYTLADSPQLRIYNVSGSNIFRVGYVTVATGPVQHFRGREPTGANVHLVHNNWGVSTRYYPFAGATFSLDDDEGGQSASLDISSPKSASISLSNNSTDAFIYMYAEHVPAHKADEGLLINVGDDYLGFYIAESGSNRLQIYPDTDGYDLDFIDGASGKWNIVSADGSRRAALSNLTDASINIVFEGGGNAITTGIKTDIVIDFDCIIQSATLLADLTGSIVIDIWKDSYANYPPTDADSITASAPPTITSAVKSQDTTLTGWSKTISAGDTLRFNVDSCSTITRCTLDLKVRRI